MVASCRLTLLCFCAKCCMLTIAAFPLTQSVPFFTVKELEQRSGAGREPRGGSFPGAVRFPPSVPSSGQGAGEGVAVTAQGQGQVVRKGVFSATERFSDVTSALVTPAPGDYRIKRLFEGGRDRQVSAERCEELMEAIEGKRALRNQNCNFMANQVGHVGPNIVCHLICNSWDRLWGCVTCVHCSRRCLVLAAVCKSTCSTGFVWTACAGGAPSGRM